MRGIASDHPYASEFAEDAVDFGVGDFDEFLVVDGVLAGRILDVADFPGITVPEVFRDSEGFFFRCGKAFGQRVLLPLFHDENHIRLFYEFFSERIGAVVVQAESVRPRDVLDDLVGRAPAAGLHPGGKDAHLLSGMGEMLVDVMLHVAVQVGTTRDVGLAGDHDGKFPGE